MAGRAFDKQMEKNGFLDNLPVDDDFGLTKAKPKISNPDTVIYFKVKCPNPNCRSTNCPVYETKLPIRRHKCKDCGCLFKSIEQ